MPTTNEVEEHIAKLQGDLEMILVDGKRHWLVEGDHLLNAAELARFARKELEAREAPRPQMRVDRLVQELGPDNKPMRAGPWPLRWCLDTNFTAAEAAQVRAGMLQATAEWESICNVRFVLDETATPVASDQLFVVRRLAGGGSLVAEAFFPWQGGDRRRVLIADGFFAADSRFDRVGVLRHELGHVLGFRHEHIREEADAPPRLHEGWSRAAPMGSYDPRSVMHYVFGSKGSYELAFTAYDRYHAWEAYPWPDRGPTANPYVDAPAALTPAAPAAATRATGGAADGGLQVSIPLEHIVNLGAGGALSSDGWISSDEAHVRRVVDAFLASGRDSLTLYLHGGLNSERQGVLTAESLIHTLQADFETYPLFFVWESGPVDSLIQRLDAISGTDLFQRIYRKIRKHLVKWRKARNEAPDLETEVALDLIEQELPVGNPAALDPLLGEYDDPGDAGVSQLEAALAQDPMIQQRLDQIAGASAVSAGLLDPDELDAATDWLDASLVQGLREEHAAQRGVATGLGAGTVFSILKFAAKILIKVAARFRDGTHHGFHATLVEELLRAMYADKLGRAMWSQMKDNAAGAYGPNGGATLFLRELAARADLSRLQLNLVGQSAGAIHACHLVRHVAQTWPTTFAAFHTVTFTVPACDPALFLDTVVRNGHRIRRFRLFQMSDEAERADALVAAAPFLYPSSLLYLVSGVCEDTTDAPILGMQRFLTDRPADEKMRQIRRFFAEINLRYRAIYVSPDPPAAAFTSHAGERGPIADPLTLTTIAAAVRPGAPPVGASAMATVPSERGQFDGFSLHLRADPGSRSALEAKVAAVLGGGWRAVVTPQGAATEVELLPPPGVSLSAAEAWERAYALSAGLGAEVEPLFLGGTPQASPEPGAGLGLHLPNWHLDAIDIASAWALAPARGAGVIIGHPDTGYTRHREIFDERLLWRRGYDFVRDDADPEDPMTEGLAGHGTRTAGVIVSGEDGRVPERPSVNIKGTAPRASLLPLRVGRSPVLFSTRNLARAIDHAIDEGARVISISMGGPPSLKLSRAVRRAVEAGAVVVAAAGQIEPIVPWPGRLDDVITVAGHEPDGAPWALSARGASVDLAGPATRIWVATWGAGEPPPPASEKMETSWGTSYATAMTAGVVALWLERHGDAVGPHRGAYVTWAFRETLRTCGLIPVTGTFGSSWWGHGRLDAGAILKAALPAPTQGPALEAPRGVLDELTDMIQIELDDRVSTAEVLSGLMTAQRLSAAQAEQLLSQAGPELQHLIFRDPEARRRLAGAVRVAKGGGLGATAAPLDLGAASPTLRRLAQG